MDEDTDAWLLELLRVTEPGGYLYITIQDQDWIDATLERGRDDWLTQFLDGNRSLLDELGGRYSMLAFARGGPEAMVIHDRAALVARWSGYADVVSVTSRAFFSQSALVLRRRR